MASLLRNTFLALAVVAAWAAPSGADRIEPTPTELEKVDIQEHLGAPLPLGTHFFDERGKEVRLDELFGSKPIILTFNYSACPMLCSVQLGGLVDAMHELDWDLGQFYDVVTISLDPKETPARTLATKEDYLSRYNRPGTEASWHFLKGDKASIDAVAQAVGFGYTFHPERKEYLHPAALMLISPQGNVSGYVYGTVYNPEELRDRLVTASVGETSESLEQFIHACYHYVAPTGYGALVSKIMRGAGILFVVGLVVFIATYGRKRAMRGQHGLLSRES